MRLAGLVSDESGQGGSPSFLPPTQPALLTLTADGAMRIWVEVTVAPPTPPLPAPVSSSASPQHPKPSQQVWCSVLLQRKPQRLSMCVQQRPLLCHHCQLTLHPGPLPWCSGG